ncbi:MAG: hypothetical protein ACI8RZ_003046 [Myxococcota bacterium]|jgi:hypothetical protein
MLFLIGASLAASVADLAQTAQSGGDPVARGEAILALSAEGSPEAAAVLQALYLTRDLDPLIRTWAGAALIQQTQSARDVLTTSNYAIELPALARPIQLRLAQVPLEDFPVHYGLLSMTNPLLTDTLAPSLLAQPPEKLVDAMLTHESDGARRIAAGLLATPGPADAGGADAVIEALSWRAGDAVPWAGGALFVPGLTWSGSEALALVEALIAWHVYCDRMGLTDEQRQLTNNLRSVSLLQAAGMGRRGANTTESWLMLLGSTHGQAAVDRILVPQGLEQEYAVTLP